MTSIQIMSDLHLEVLKNYESFEIVPKAPHLALLGDIGNVIKHRDHLLTFFNKQLQQFRTVLFVPGNHEAYGSSWSATLDVLRTFEKDNHDTQEDTQLGQFVLLDRTALRIPDSNIIVLGCSLFSWIPVEHSERISRVLQDFHRTENWDYHKHNEAHRQDLAWLNDQVTDIQKTSEGAQIIILSHWCPSFDDGAIEDRHRMNPVSRAFATDLSDEPCFRSGQVKVWAFGHTHFNCDFAAERTGKAGPLRLVTNQRGYEFAQSSGFDGEKVIEL